MKKYYSLGELLFDYRKYCILTQSEFAARLDVDIKTIQRWEKNSTLINQEKEEKLVFETLLPYQLIRNLNAVVAIPTYFDFEIQKYYLTGIAKNFPKTQWFRDQKQLVTRRLRRVDFKYDIDYIMRFLKLKNNELHTIDKKVILKAIEILPELNLIITDDSGYYAGHSLIFPITVSAYKKLKKREILKEDLTVNDIVNYKGHEHLIFMGYDTNADCNDNFYYLFAPLFIFFEKLRTRDYLFISSDNRFDYFKLREETGMKCIWENAKNEESPTRFYEGNFKTFMSE